MTEPQPTSKTVLSAPYAWFRNIIRLQEKRAFGVFPILLFCAFVGIARLLGEWFIGSHPIHNALVEVFGFTVFYWHMFFAYGLILFLLVPQPWRKSINVIYVGIFLGLFPPIVDFFVYDLAQARYAYFWAFPEGWRWWLFNPEHNFYFGEAFVLWLTIGLTAAYVGHKTRSWVRAGLAGGLGYGVVVLQSAVVPATLRRLTESHGWQGGQLVYLLITAQILLPLVVYLICQPAVRTGLMRRAPHALPFVMMSLVGAAWAGQVTVFSLVNTALVFITFMTALVQNDFYDAADDAVQGRTPYVDLEDVRFFTITAAMLVFALMAMNSMVGALLLLILILSFLYSYPFYRAKRYFPSNLKIEGVWGLASFLVGVVGTLEYQLLNQPRWEIAGTPGFARELNYPGAAAIVAAFLVFGGHSLLAMLKDYKDVAADRAAGVQTVYTLAQKRGWPLGRVHRLVSLTALACVAAPLPLLYLQQKIGGAWLAGGLVAVALFAAVLGQTQKRFGWFLGLMTAYLAYLFIALSV